MGNHFATIDMGEKVEGAAVPLSVGWEMGPPPNTMSPGQRPTFIPSGILIHPTIWPQYSNVTDRQDKQRSDSTGGTLRDQLESYQKRALRIIYGDQITGMPYFNILFLANLESSKDRREKISKSFFKKILSSDSCLHSLSHLNVILNFYVNYAAPQNILFPIPELKDTSLS